MTKFTSLCIDIGNTNTKIGLFKDDKLEQFQLFATEQSEEVVRFVESIIALKIDGAIVSNVSRAEKELISKIRQRINFFIELNHQTPLPIHIKYETPTTLGTDRIAAACASWKKSRGNPSLAITCGTCIIYDYTDANGNYVGGAISPGIWQRLKSLHEFSANLPLVEPLSSFDFPGKNTNQSILAGVIKGATHEIDGFIDEIKQFEPRLHVYLSGGDAHHFATNLKNSIFAVPSLIMEGLNQILQFNVKII